jgi:hypothetical protein
MTEGTFVPDGICVSHPIETDMRDGRKLSTPPNQLRCDGKRSARSSGCCLKKMTGTVAYAGARCGGFLKSDKHHYPVRWNSLKDNAARKAYDTNLTPDKRRSGPSELDGREFDWGDRSLVYRHPHCWTV